MTYHRELSGPRLQRMREALGPEKTEARLKEHISKGELTLKNVSIRQLAEGLIENGREYVQHHLRPGTSYSAFREAADAVDSALFANITGQLLFTEVLEQYTDEQFVFSGMVETRKSNFLDMEKVPGFGRTGEVDDVIAEGDPYPLLGISENFVEIGPKKKRGGIIGVTREAVFSDLTGQLLETAGGVGWGLGLNKEKRVIDAVIDENAGAASAVVGGHRYHWKGTSYATYQTTTPWDNVVTDVLATWEDVESAWQTLAAIQDPFTQEPIMIEPDTLIVTPDLLGTASRIVSATEVRSGDITASPGTQTITGNPIQYIIGNRLKVVSSRLLKARMADDSNWFLGNVNKLVRYYSNWEMETEQAPANSPEAFHRDIMSQFKVSERGIASVIEPRVMCKSTA